MTTSSFTVVVDPRSLSRSSRGQISGVVYVEIDGTPFPESTWSDSVLIVLSSWIEGLTALTSDASDEATLRFMDGPFRLELARGLSGAHLRAVDARRGEATVIETDAELDAIYASVVAAASRVLSECSDRAWWSPDVDHLVLLTSQREG